MGKPKELNQIKPIFEQTSYPLEKKIFTFVGNNSQDTTRHAL